MSHDLENAYANYATRYPEAIPLRNIDTATVKKALLDLCIRVKIPEEVFSDLKIQFVSTCIQSRLLLIRRLKTTPYHSMIFGLPSSNDPFRFSSKAVTYKISRSSYKHDLVAANKSIKIDFSLVEKI